MKTLFLIFHTVWLQAIFTVLQREPVSEQNMEFERYFKFKDNHSGANGNREYDVMMRWQITDAIEGGNVNTGIAVKANYYVLDNDTVGWRNVALAKIENLNDKAGKWYILNGFESLKYKALSTDFLRNDLYGSIDGQNREIARMLTADAVTMQEMGSYIVDSLEFMKEFFPVLMNNNEIDLESSYTFHSRYLKYIWSGITFYNGKACAIVKFESFFNPFENIHFKNKGRSMYYGELWISLDEKTVEYSVMVEDVIYKDFNQLAEPVHDMQREIIFKRVK